MLRGDCILDASGRCFGGTWPASGRPKPYMRRSGVRLIWGNLRAQCAARDRRNELEGRTRKRSCHTDKGAANHRTHNTLKPTTSFADAMQLFSYRQSPHATGKFVLRIIIMEVTSIQLFADAPFASYNDGAGLVPQKNFKCANRELDAPWPL